MNLEINGTSSSSTPSSSTHSKIKLMQYSGIALTTLALVLVFTSLFRMLQAFNAADEADVSQVGLSASNLAEQISSSLIPSFIAVPIGLFGIALIVIAGVRKRKI